MCPNPAATPQEYDLCARNVWSYLMPQQIEGQQPPARLANEDYKFLSITGPV